MSLLPLLPSILPLLQHEFSPRACSCGGSSGAAAFFRQEPRAVQVLGGYRRGPLQCSHHPNRGTSLPTSLCPVQPLRAFFLFFLLHHSFFCQLTSVLRDTCGSSLPPASAQRCPQLRRGDVTSPPPPRAPAPCARPCACPVPRLQREGPLGALRDGGGAEPGRARRGSAGAWRPLAAATKPC